MKNFKQKLATVLCAGALAFSAGVVGAAPAQAASCSGAQTSSSQMRDLSVVCSGGGSQYRITVTCGWYSAGKGGSYSKSSSWVKSGARAYVSCGGAYIVRNNPVFRAKFR